MNTKTINFLSTYSPKDENITSREEMNQIADALNLKSEKTTEELRSIRNEVMDFYNEKMNQEGWQKWMTPMQSVTSVIEFVMYGGEL